MANFRNKQAKIKLLCERADKEEVLRDELASRGASHMEIMEAVHDKRLEKYRTNTAETKPWEENGKVVKILNTTNIGLADTHLVKTSAQAMSAGMQKRFDKYKTEKKTMGATAQSAEKNLEGSRAHSVGMDISKRAQKTFAQKEQDRLIKEQNFRDHLFEMRKGMDVVNKVPNSSEYGKEFEFNKNMQDLCDTQNFDHHLRKNDLKWFAEAYVKYKGTMRK